MGARKRQKSGKLIQQSGKRKKDCKLENPDEKYGLRACSIQKRIEVEVRKGLPKKRGPKPKPRPLPMTKYRRKTANLRERMRMGEINVAFERLRERIPTLTASNKNRCEKLTKINILHVAINYIKALENILDTGEPGIQVFGTTIVRGPLDSVDGLETTNMRIVKNKPSQVSSPLNDLTINSCSKDSGIEDLDPDDILCPDWTELTSTLEFLPDPQLPVVPELTTSTIPLTLDLSFSKSANHNQNDYKQVMDYWILRP